MKNTINEVALVTNIAKGTSHQRIERITCSKPNTRFAHSISLVISKLDLASRGATMA